MCKPRQALAAPFLTAAISKNLGRASEGLAAQARVLTGPPPSVADVHPFTGNGSLELTLVANCDHRDWRECRIRGCSFDRRPIDTSERQKKKTKYDRRAVQLHFR
jgi:hypothetical protein